MNEIANKEAWLNSKWINIFQSYLSHKSKTGYMLVIVNEDYKSFNTRFIENDSFDKGEFDIVVKNKLRKRGVKEKFKPQYMYVKILWGVDTTYTSFKRNIGKGNNIVELSDISIGEKTRDKLFKIAD